MKKLVLALFLSVFCGMLQAENEAILATLKKLNIKSHEIFSSPIAGLKLVVAEDNLFYISDDGRYLVNGTVFDLSTPVATNITFQHLNQTMEAMKESMIIYPAQKEQHVVTVFTDITCGYCRKLHDDLKNYNDLGITVRYLAFPRDGMDSQTAKDMQSVWCMGDRNKAYDAAIKGETISPATCKIDIKEQYQLGLKYGIQGTPAIVLENGVVIPGYQNAENTLALLQKIKRSVSKTETKR